MENWLPHFILPNKVLPVNGNYYAHEIGGLLAANDFSTGISFSPASELFHWEGWFGFFVLGPFLWGLLFFVSDFVSGDLRVYPWGLLLGPHLRARCSGGGYRRSYQFRLARQHQRYRRGPVHDADCASARCSLRRATQPRCRGRAPSGSAACLRPARRPPSSRTLSLRLSPELRL